ncbi:DUF4350 domain-containing protein [Stutzerimonas chloritidismutans]|uniref:DUF4350 domain-containing protein n=1 Tax=Stutzerimonas chloritidismutans TaxID=203192 RepID=UPI003F14CACD
MSRRTVLVIIAAALLIGAGLAYLVSKATPYEEVVEHGPAPEAAADPYLAARLFLESQGRPVARSVGLDGLTEQPPAGQVLLLLGDRSKMTPAQTRRLLAWVEQGGHLIFVAEQLWEETTERSGDLLLDALELQQHEASTEPAEGGTATEEHPQQPRLTRLFLENEDAPAFLAFDTRFHLYDAGHRAHAWANSDDATHMLQLAHGQGLVTALTDAWLWQNANIGRYDHAWLLWYLTQNRDVQLAYDTQHDGLVQQLLRHFPEVLAALLLLILLGAWHVGQRHGPLIETHERSRRRLHEHLRAGADFLYRRAGQRHLLDTLQSDIRRLIRAGHPNFEHLPHDEQCRRLASLTQLPDHLIEQALTRPAKAVSAAEFTRQVAYLQRIRNSL